MHNLRGSATTKVGRSLLRLQSMQSQDVDGPERPDTDSFTNISENNDLDISSQREQSLDCIRLQS